MITSLTKRLKRACRLFSYLLLAYAYQVEGKTQPAPVKQDASSASDNLSVVAALLSESVDLNLLSLAESVKALGEEYALLYTRSNAMNRRERQKWLINSRHSGEVTIYHPFDARKTIGYQSPFPSYLYYKSGDPSQNTWRSFKVFETLSLSFKNAYETFDDSWVYMTTVDDAFLIYPYLPLKQAVKNTPPTKQLFYTSADFKNKTFGWTPPYLDLAGAGLMVTVCYPAYHENELLGVVSRDITIRQLTKKILSPISKSQGKIKCVIIDKNGLVIANSDPEDMKEIEMINEKAKTTVCYYRASKSLKSLTMAGARNSGNELCNRIGEAALKHVKKNPESAECSFKLSANKQTYSVNVGKVKTTGWLVLTIGRD